MPPNTPARVGDLDSGLADVLTVGTMALSNPDLTDRPLRADITTGAESGRTRRVESERLHPELMVQG